jgi:hypothetical protein
MKEVTVPAVNHQTIKLSKGKHTSPERGACVMELASMLAGERFTDHPRSVSRVIAAFLRGYNDLVDHERRQDLYRYAALCVGTTDGDTVEEARVERLLRWSDGRRSRVGLMLWFARLRRSCSRTSRIGPEGAANYALRTLVRTDASHSDALRLVDDLIGLGKSDLDQGVLPAGAIAPSSGCGPERLELPALS